jgi:cellulose synthase/poly-beta-1,6-N-acetylglucosamine synthase-like glycosyltransferase
MAFMHMQIDKPEVTNVTKKKLPSISIIIPVYSEEKRIERGLSRTLSFCQFAGWVSQDRQWN